MIQPETHIENEDDERIVLITHTIEDGPVARWYVHLAAAENGIEYMSASRNGVLVYTFLHKISPKDHMQAQAIYDQLKRDRHADIRHYATHRRTRLFGGELAPVEPASDGAA